MLIRPMQANDVLPLAQLMAAAPLWQRYQVTLASATQRLQSGLAQNATIFVAELEDLACGFIWYVTTGAFNRSGYIMLIGVSAQAQRHGVGRALMQRAETEMFAKTNDVFLLVSDFNVTAQKFYQRLGYGQVGALPNYVTAGITELIYRKQKLNT